MSNKIRIASNSDVLDSISRRVDLEDYQGEYGYYFIVSVSNNDDTLDDLENFYRESKLRITHMFIFSNFSKSRLYVYIKVKSAISARTVYSKFEEMGYENIRLRMRLYGIKKNDIMNAIRGGFDFGEYPFPLRPIFREIDVKDRVYCLERGVKYVEMRQPDFVKAKRRGTKSSPSAG